MISLAQHICSADDQQQVDVYLQELHTDKLQTVIHH